jgi:hypothetical protein
MAERHHCLWESPDGQVAIYLSFSVVDAINAAIAEAAGSAPVRGAEIGGVLMGKAERQIRLMVWVDNFELLPCRYERGPSFHLDTESAPDLEKAGIVGYFRSHTRKDLFLGPDDQQLIQRHFSKEENVFLLVKPFKTRPNLAGFFYHKDGTLDPSASAREFPFHRRELGGGEPAAAAIPECPEIEDESDIPIDVVAPEKRRPILLWAMLAFFGFAATGSVTYLLFEKTKPIPAASKNSASPLGLTAAEGERDIRLSWDRQSPSIRLAARGAVEIREGTFQKSLDIDTEQLRSGSVIYSRPVAIADTVGFKLRLFFEQGQAISETVQLVSNRAILPSTLRLAAPLPAEAAPPVLMPRVEAKVEPAPVTQVATKKAPPAKSGQPVLTPVLEVANSVPPTALEQTKPIQAPPQEPIRAVAKSEPNGAEKTKPEPTTVLARPAPRRIP